MRVFISWSGELSRQLAEIIRDWLPSALQFVKPYFSPNDIEKGARWEAMLAEELALSAVGIFVMTHENLDSKWLHFEAGAIAKTVEKTRVCTFVFGIEPTDIVGPLSHFQSTKFEKADVKKLFMAINAAGDEASLADATAGKVFERWWPDLEKQIGEVLKAYKPHEEHKHTRSERELLEEILLLVRRTASGDALRTAAGWTDLLRMHWEKGITTKDVALRIGLPDPKRDELDAFRQNVLGMLEKSSDYKIITDRENELTILVPTKNVVGMLSVLQRLHPSLTAQQLPWVE